MSTCLLLWRRAFYMAFLFYIRRHVRTPTADEKRKMYNGDSNRIAQSLQRFIKRVGEEDGAHSDTERHGTGQSKG